MRHLGATDVVVAAGEPRQLCDLYACGYLGWVENKRGNLQIVQVEHAGRSSLPTVVGD
jgi:hypothetical protein